MAPQIFKNDKFFLSFFVVSLRYGLGYYVDKETL